MNKMNYPLVAIVIPTLNEALFIGPCLDSILGQNYPFNRLDIMVVDGGSDDKTHEIVNGYADKWSNIRWIDNPRKIQSAAFNIGVSRSSASIEWMLMPVMLVIISQNVSPNYPPIPNWGM
jgi:glycosyltransferase involved in cell wall biosynthesis